MFKINQTSLLELKDESESSLQQVYLVYHNIREYKKPWYWPPYIKDGFEHVYILKYVEPYWIRITPAIGFLNVDVLTHAPYDSIHNIVNDESATIQFASRWRKFRLRNNLVLAPFTCVEVAKAVLGIRKKSILTPWQLYNYIKKEG